MFDLIFKPQYKFNGHNLYNVIYCHIKTRQTDLIQEGALNLIKAVDRIDWETIKASEDKEKTIKSFLSKRIKGGIRREIDNYMSIS